MGNQFDLFRFDDSNKPVWFGTANTLDDAKEQIQRNSLAAKATYLVYSQLTAEKIFYITSRDTVVRVSEHPAQQN
jgi:hypothetical protein